MLLRNTMSSQLQFVPNVSDEIFVAAIADINSYKSSKEKECEALRKLVVDLGDELTAESEHRLRLMNERDLLILTHMEEVASLNAKIPNSIASPAIITTSDYSNFTPDQLYDSAKCKRDLAEELFKQAKRYEIEADFEFNLGSIRVLQRKNQQAVTPSVTPSVTPTVPCGPSNPDCCHQSSVAPAPVVIESHKEWYISGVLKEKEKESLPVCKGTSKCLCGEKEAHPVRVKSWADEMENGSCWCSQIDVNLVQCRHCINQGIHPRKIKHYDYHIAVMSQHSAICKYCKRSFPTIMDSMA